MGFSNQVECAINDYEKIDNMESLLGYFDDKTIKSMISPIYRFIMAWKSNHEKDAMSNLRQCLVYANSQLHLNVEIIKICKKYENDFGFLIDGNLKWVEAKAYAMEEVPNLKYTYNMQKMRSLKPSVGDAALYNYFGYDHYVSLQQKTMIYVSKQLKKGETYLACLPTGSGKSLLWQSAVARGQFEGVTIVVVPTVALGLDHKKSDDVNLKRLPWVESIAYTSRDFSDNEKKMSELCEKIKYGKQKIIYISPEGLTNYSLRMALIEAAKRQNVSAIVIDETHLVIDWGMNFRPEFQFLPALIKNLQSFSNEKITTVLLSATITENDRDILFNLFGGKRFVEFRGDELRSEIEFYSQNCSNEDERKKYIKQLIKTVPRPVIVYVGTIEQSKQINDLIRKEGMYRTAVFTSTLSDERKEELIEEWKNNCIDIMVATSAFGMGVDKSDVRTIITAYTPENISRFYQEVGRSGRDGYTSLSFSLPCPIEDSRVVASYTDSKVLGADNLVARWRAMIDNRINHSFETKSNIAWISTDVAPAHLAFQTTGALNSGWNEDVISLFSRAGLISILDVRRQYNSNHKSFKIQIELKEENISLLENDTSLLNFISSYRNQERAIINGDKKIVAEMLKSNVKQCWADYFDMEFLYSNSICSGCPYCRKNNLKHYYEESEMRLYADRSMYVSKRFAFKNGIDQCVERKGLGYFVADINLDNTVKFRLIKRLIISGVNIIVCNNISELDINEMAEIPQHQYMILNFDEYKKIPDHLKCGTMVFFLDQDKFENQEMLDQIKSNRYDDVNQIIVAEERYFDSTEDRYLSDYTDYGKKISVLLQEDVIC